MDHLPSTSAHAQPGAATTHPMHAVLWPATLTTSAVLAVAAAGSDWTLLWWLAAVTAATAGLFFALSGAARNPARRVHLHGDTITVQMRRTFPIAAAGFAATLGAFLGTTAAGEDDPVVRVAAALGCALCLAPLPDLVRAALIGTHLTFDATRITVRSWTTQAQVDWADVTAVDTDITIPTRPAVCIHTRPGAPTLTSRRRRLLVPLEPRTPEAEIVVPAIAFDEPWLLAGRLATLVGLTPADRAHRVGQPSVQMLTGQTPLHA